MEYFKLFVTAFTQVCLVAMNVTFISYGFVIAMIITGFGISYIWAGNIKKVAFGTEIDKLVYASGAGVGTYVGYRLALFLTHVL